MEFINNSLLISEVFILTHELFHFLYNYPETSIKQKLKQIVNNELLKLKIKPNESIEEFFCDFWACVITYEMFRHSENDINITNIIKSLSRSLNLFTHLNVFTENISIKSQYLDHICVQNCNEALLRSQFIDNICNKLFIREDFYQNNISFINETENNLNYNYNSTFKLLNYFLSNVKLLNDRNDTFFEKIKHKSELVEYFCGFNLNQKLNDLEVNILQQEKEEIFNYIQNSNFELYQAFHTYPKELLVK